MTRIPTERVPSEDAMWLYLEKRRCRCTSRAPAYLTVLSR